MLRSLSFKPSRTLMALAVASVVGAAAPSAHAFWFLCSMRDSAKAAKIADAARKRYFDYLASSTASQAQIDACKGAWDRLRDRTLAEIKTFAASVPNTSLTGPSNLEDLIKDAIREAIKEALGQALSLNLEGMPGGGSDGRIGQFARPAGDFVAAPIYQQIPVPPLSAANITVTRLGYLTPGDYDGSEGPPPQGWDQAVPLIIIDGTFQGVPFGACVLNSPNPNSIVFGGTPVDFPALEQTFIANRFQAVFDTGVITTPLIDWIDAQNFPWDPFDKVHASTMEQTGFIEITTLDPVSGTMSGRFFSVAGPGPLWDNGPYDGRTALASELNTFVPDARSADDFTLAPGNGMHYRPHSVKATVLQDSSTLLNDAILEIYADSGTGGPANAPPLMTLRASGSLIIGQSFGVPVVEYTFAWPAGQMDASTSQWAFLAPGARYWLSPIGLGDGTHVDRAYFGSATNMLPSQRGYFRSSDGFNNWTPVAHPSLLGAQSEFAFELDAVQLLPIAPGSVRVTFGPTVAANAPPACQIQFVRDMQPPCPAQVPVPAAAGAVAAAARAGLTGCGQTVNTAADNDTLTVLGLAGTSFGVGTCGGMETVTVVGAAPSSAQIRFAGPFANANGQTPTIFTAGIVTDVGELTAQVSAAELNFQTEGPIICQALFQRLAPRAPQFGVTLDYPGSDFIIVTFDPRAPVATPQGIYFPPLGVTAGTTSGAGQPFVLINDLRRFGCPADFNGDGNLDPDDLADFITCFFTQVQFPGMCLQADFNADGNVDPDDLADYITAFFAGCA